MKPTTPNPQRPPTATPVVVEFIPQAGWAVAIGRLPAKAFASPQSKRDKAPAPAYKRPGGISQPTDVFVPVGLMIDAEEQPVSPTPYQYRATPKQPVNH